MMLSRFRKHISSVLHLPVLWRLCTKRVMRWSREKLPVPLKEEPRGGVAVLTRTHHQARAAQHFCIEGCGFSAVELRVKGMPFAVESRVS